MKFDCKNLSVDDEESGCTVLFSDKEEHFDPDEKLSIDEVIASLGQYIMLQRTYAEEEFEEDYYFIENSDFDKSGELKHFTIDLSRNKFLLTYKNELFEIDLNINDHEFENLKTALKKIANKEGQLKINL